MHTVSWKPRGSFQSQITSSFLALSYQESFLVSKNPTSGLAGACCTRTGRIMVPGLSTYVRQNANVLQQLRTGLRKISSFAASTGLPSGAIVTATAATSKRVGRQSIPLPRRAEVCEISSSITYSRIPYQSSANQQHVETLECEIGGCA